MRMQSITDMIGNTLLSEVNERVKYYAKIEDNNLFDSVKEREARYLTENAYEQLLLGKRAVKRVSCVGGYQPASVEALCRIQHIFPFELNIVKACYHCIRQYGTEPDSSSGNEDLESGLENPKIMTLAEFLNMD